MQFVTTFKRNERKLNAAGRRKMYIFSSIAFIISISLNQMCDNTKLIMRKLLTSYLSSEPFLHRFNEKKKKKYRKKLQHET